MKKCTKCGVVVEEPTRGDLSESNDAGEVVCWECADSGPNAKSQKYNLNSDSKGKTPSAESNLFFVIEDCPDKTPRFTLISLGAMNKEEAKGLFYDMKHKGGFAFGSLLSLEELNALRAVVAR